MLACLLYKAVISCCIFEVFIPWQSTNAMGMTIILFNDHTGTTESKFESESTKTEYPWTLYQMGINSSVSFDGIVRSTLELLQICIGCQRIETFSWLKTIFSKLRCKSTALIIKKQALSNFEKLIFFVNIFSAVAERFSTSFFGYIPKKSRK